MKHTKKQNKKMGDYLFKNPTILSYILDFDLFEVSPTTSKTKVVTK
jgi:hypothetical protein